MSATEILAQGDDWLVVAKPPRVAVHATPGAPEVPMLQRVRGAVGRHVYPVHRLDRQASGCLLFATRRAACAPLQAALQSPDTIKIYAALVRGSFAADGEVVVDASLRDARGVERAATSRVRCLGRSHDPRCSLVEVRIETGRFHQVRRHLARLSHPVLGDGDHGDTRVNRTWREARGLTRLGLHALSLEVTFPDGVRRRVRCPLFEDQAALYARMPWWDAACGAQPALSLSPLSLPPARLH